VPCAGVFGLTALAGVAAGLAVVCVVVCVVAVGLAGSGLCSRGGIVVRELVLAGVARGTGAEGSRLTGTGAACGGRLVAGLFCVGAGAGLTDIGVAPAAAGAAAVCVLGGCALCVDAGA
jgi:hypothetical protein